jgi:hypothetical protein
MVTTTTTTLPASLPIGDANSEEWIEPKAGEANIGIRRVLRAILFVKDDSAYNLRFIR